MFDKKEKLIRAQQLLYFLHESGPKGLLFQQGICSQPCPQTDPLEFGAWVFLASVAVS